MSLEAAWYRKAKWLYLLWPLSVVFSTLALARRRYWQHANGRQLLAEQSAVDSSGYKNPGTVPLVVVGNITVGGTGKTPFVIALGRLLQERGLKIGVISRGYSAKAPHHPYVVTETSHPYLSGDEPLLVSRTLKCTVVVDPNRRRALQEVLRNPCDVVISDDGMQHYALPRDIEVAMVDGHRGLGNGLCLPAGPLREPPARLREVDYLVINGGDCKLWEHLSSNASVCSGMTLVPQCWVNLRSGERMDIECFGRMARGRQDNSQKVHAIAGIGNPARFFTLLSTMGIEAVYHAFPDHYNYSSNDLAFEAGSLLLMTEKDAVKCESIAGPDCWYLAVEAELDSIFTDRLVAHIEALVHARSTSMPETPAPEATLNIEAV